MREHAPRPVHARRFLLALLLGAAVALVGCDGGDIESVPEGASPCVNVTQLYCNGSCSWAGSSGCDQADADIHCKLRTGNPSSVAVS